MEIFNFIIDMQNKGKPLRDYFVLMVVCLSSFYSCGDSPVGSGSNFRHIDPTILQTDSSGHIIGGDTTDWCYHGGSGVYFSPAYPNPTADLFKLQFSIAQTDTLTLYTLRSESDTIFFMNNYEVIAGFYEVTISSDQLGFNNVVKRFYLKVKIHPNLHPSCRYYGDVQFY
jgi:hypothetical protein